MLPTWVNDFIGLPYADKGRGAEGVDCYGLVRLVYFDVFDIRLESFVDTYETSRNAGATIEQNGIQSDLWDAVDTPIEGDVVLIRTLGQPQHVGVMLDRVNMLHSLPPHNSVIERINGSKWRHRIVGFYRFAAG